ncbi:autotransporter assembly complex protein TamA [Brevundimonas lutea]|uniref:autotransporter assembly complex protein TamA n=1 Tax=Brevundimonas lutea TaxID=2293980 RepID=UPI000F043578
MPATAVAEPRAQVRGEMDDALREQIETAVGEVDAAIENRFQARRRAQQAAESAEALLRSEGYYQSLIEDVIEGENPPQAIVDITPGPRFTLDEPQVLWIETPPDPEVGAQAIAENGLEPGEPGRAVEVIAAEGRIVAGLTRRGYADAEADERRVVVDHATQLVSPTYRINSGLLVRLDGIDLQTRGPTNPAWVSGLAPWEEGDVYDPEDVAELERRLLETNVYDGVAVALSPIDATREDGLRPIVVTLTDRPRRVLEAGLYASTSEGVGVDGLWTWVNRFGRADTLRFRARAATIDSRIGADLSIPHWRRPGRTLTLGAFAVNETTDAYDRIAVTAHADLRQRLGRTSWFRYGVGLDAGQYTENRFDPVTQTPITLDRNLALLTGRGGFYMDRSNDPLNPTRGWRVSADVQPTAVAGDDSLVFLRTEAQATAYLPIRDGGRSVLAGRVKIGSIVGGEELTIPSDRLFYSGGGGSVRGYEFQGVGPRLPDNTPRGGLSVFETSVEYRHDIGESFAAVGFLDAGSIGFQETPNLSNMRYGAGFGVRYYLPFGPVRADVAFPLNKAEGDPDFQLYISIGQAF